MKKRLVLLLIGTILLTLTKGFAQVALTRPINSNDIIEQGIQCHDRESYDSALVFYRQVDVNDPNYAWACYESGLSRYSQNHLDEAEAKAREAIALGFSNPALFTLLGSILDDMGKSAEGAAAIQGAYSKWPFNQNLLYNLGICYLNAGKLKEAEAALLKSARYFPYHTRSHLALGKVNLYMGHTAEAYLAYNMAIVMNPKSSFITEFEDAITGKYDNKIDHINYPYPEGVNAEKWNELRWLLQSEMAIDKSFNFPYKLDFVVTRQSYLLFQKAQYEPSDTSIYNQEYVRFFKDVMNTNNFENLIYYQFQNTGIAAVNQWLEKNKSKAKQFVGLAVKDINTWKSQGFEPANSTSKSFEVNYSTDGDLVSMGSYLPGNDSLRTGTWVFFNNLGGIKEVGNFSKGEIDGNYRIYYDDGTIKQNLNFANGKLNGGATTYYQNGNRSGDYQFKNDKRNGVCTYYNSSGLVDEHNEYIDGKLDGTSIKYSYSNAFTTTSHNKSGLTEGPADQTWMNGAVSEKYAFANDSLSGPYKAYYKNGVTKAEGNYTGGTQVGEWNYFFANGKLKTTGNYSSDGERTGVWRYYNFNGTLESVEDAYVNGQLNGTRTEYFPDGKKKEIYVYKDNVLKTETAFDLAGNVIVKADTTSETFVDKDYFANGVLRLEGGIKNGNRNGLWRYYNPNGILTSELTYVDDDQSGPQKTYYVNGTIHEEYYCDSNKINGLYREYYKSGKLKSQSWYINDLQQGPSITYFYNGKVESSGFLNKGVEVGEVTLYTSDGKINEELTFNDDGILTAIKQYNSMGSLLDSAFLPNGNGKAIQHFENGQVKSIQTYAMGNFNDSLTSFFPNGNVRARSYYIYGKLNGSLKMWDSKGRIYLEKTYLLGDNEGEYHSYNDGVLFYDGSYLNDEENGISKIYHPNGKTYKEYEWQNGDRTGYSNYYSPDGVLMYRLQYIDGAIVGFSYLGKDGKMADDIPTSSYTGELVAYFPSGVVSARINMKNGMLNGMRTEYYTSGKKFRETELAYNDYHGKDLFYFPSGSISEQKQYEYDKETNDYKAFYENGKIKVEGAYYMDEKEGWWKSYSVSGKLTEEARYVDGAIVELKASK
ncbi:MAG TPA: tetratricopeptide repeat protein [Williamwhitmania sp.]|nr:tetratricopeptide repeat protein [Williamwhitmania sp.]